MSDTARSMRFEIVPERSQVWIDASSSVHPIHANASGLRGWFEATLEDEVLGPPVAGRVEVDVDRLRSGNPLVDRETRRRVDAKRHPTVEGRLTEVVGVEGSRLSVLGEIALRGVSREVSGELDVTPLDGGVHIEGEQTFDVRDWGLEPPKLLALKVHPDVEVRVSIEARAE